MTALGLNLKPVLKSYMQKMMAKEKSIIKISNAIINSFLSEYIFVLKLNL